MEDNAPAHIHHYHNLQHQQLGFQKLEWSPNSPDLNPIKTIWCEMKDRIKERLQVGIWITVSSIQEIVADQWLNYPLAKVNHHHILSMPGRIEACVRDGGDNNFMITINFQ